MLQDDGSRVNISATDRVDSLLDLPSDDLVCRRVGPAMHLQQIANPGNQKVTGRICGAWACPGCAAYKRLRAGRHYGAMILQSRGSLFSEHIRPVDWPKRKRRFQGRRPDSPQVDWVRVGDLVIWSIAVRDGVTAHADTESAVTLLGHALRAIDPPPTVPDEHYVPITSSRPWSLPDSEPKYELLGWVTVTDPTVVIERLRALGIARDTIRTRTGSGSKLWDVIFSCEPGSQQRVAAALASREP